MPEQESARVSDMGAKPTAELEVLRTQLVALQAAHKTLRSDVDKHRKRVGELESRSRADADQLASSLARGLPLTAMSAALVVLLAVPWLGRVGDYDGHVAVMSGWAAIGEAFDGNVAVLGLLTRIAIIATAFLGISSAVAIDSVGLRWTTTAIAGLTAVGVVVVLSSFGEWQFWENTAGGIVTIGCLVVVAAMAAPVRDDG